jgi:predicted transcriptional regulator
MKAISLKLDDEQLKLLDQISQETHISKSVLVRKGIDFILHQYKEDVVTNEFRQAVDKLLVDDHVLLNKLSKM